MAAAAPLLKDTERFGYLKPKDVARLEDAYRFSEAAHAGQTRQSGEPYISHPLAVAEILADWHLDGQTLMAALLHDVTEDTSVTKDEISDTFGKPVAELVDGVSKLDKIEFQSAEHVQAENFRKMLLAMARDVRVILIKLADRLHNMRTLGAVSPAKRRRVARETMEIYAPIANRLGLNTLYHELQELAFSHLYPLRYRVLAKATKAARGNRREMISKTLEAIKKKFAERWLQSLLEIQHQSGDPHEFLEHVKVDLFPDEVYVFTPKGRILSLPRGATAVDFAYAVHTDIGNRCVAAKVNGELVPLRSELRNGDRAEIITASHAKPNPGWLQYVRTAKARSNIRHFLKTMQYEESAGLGERLLDQAIKALNGSLAEVDDASWERVVRDGGARSREELLADIGLGKRLPAVVARRLLKRGDSTREDAKPGGSVVIRGTEGMAVQLATCCRPIPGDEIVGSIKKGQGLVVHASDCGSIVRSRRNEPDQWIDVEWDPRTTRLFQAAINAMVENRRGVLAKVASEIAEAGSNIDSITMAEDRAVFTNMHFVVEVANRQHLARVMRALRRLPDVKKITRVRE